jgi:hypothetical protein
MFIRVQLTRPLDNSVAIIGFLLGVVAWWQTGHWAWLLGAARELRMIRRQYPRVVLVAVVLSFGVALSSSKEVLRAQNVDKPAIPPQPRTINLTQEQRFIIKENVKDLGLSKA